MLSPDRSDFLGRAGIIATFSVFAVLKLHAILSQAGSLWQAFDHQVVLNLAVSLANLAFLVLVVGITLFRLRPQGAALGLEPRITALAGTFAMIFITAFPRTIVLPEGVQLLALALTALGFALSAYVLSWLGRSFSIMAESRRLVTAGPYRIVRHPLYAVEELALVGIVLLNLSWPAVILAGLHWLLQLRRMHNEEQVLSRTFPEYAAYAARTPRIIPFLRWPFPATQT